MYKKKNTDLSYKFDAQYMYFTMFTHFNKSHPPPPKNKKFQNFFYSYDKIFTCISYKNKSYIKIHKKLTNKNA